MASVSFGMMDIANMKICVDFHMKKSLNVILMKDVKIRTANISILSHRFDHLLFLFYTEGASICIKTRGDNSEEIRDFKGVREARE